MNHHYAVVQPYLSVLELRLAEAGTGGIAVDGFPIDDKPRFNGIQVTVAPRPEV